MSKVHKHHCFLTNHPWGELADKFESYKACPDCIAQHESYLDAKITYGMLKRDDDMKWSCPECKNQYLINKDNGYVCSNCGYIV